MTTTTTTVTTSAPPRRRSPLPPLRTAVRTSDVTDDLFVNSVLGAAFLARTEEDDLRHLASRTFPRRAQELGELDGLGRVELTWAVGEQEDALLTLEATRGPALVVVADGSCEVVVAAGTRTAAREAAVELERMLRDAPPADDRVALRFWAVGQEGGEVRRRTVDAPAWEEIAPNYPAAVRAAMSGLTAATEPAGGSLVLWHGSPGTGKTHALQALTRAWKPWCTTHYVTDPEQLLRGTAYLMDVAASPLGSDERPWRLIVLEDAGELMAADARSDVGQGLSRVLNLTDGLLGQGLRCVLLVTTNEPLGRLHPAIRRPGRCWAEVEFPAFAGPEAAVWLARRGVADAGERPRTLAELYALAEGRSLDGPPGAGRTIGFG